VVGAVPLKNQKLILLMVMFSFTLRLVQLSAGRCVGRGRPLQELSVHGDDQFDGLVTYGRAERLVGDCVTALCVHNLRKGRVEALPRGGGEGAGSGGKGRERGKEEIGNSVLQLGKRFWSDSHACTTRRFGPSLETYNMHVDKPLGHGKGVMCLGRGGGKETRETLARNIEMRAFCPLLTQQYWARDTCSERFATFTSCVRPSSVRVLAAPSLFH